MEWKLVRESVFLFNMDVTALEMLRKPPFVPQVFACSQEHHAVLHSKKWSTSLLVPSIVDRYLLFQHSIQNKPPVVIQKKLDFGMIGVPGQLAAQLVEHVEHKAETAHVLLQRMDVLAQEIHFKLDLAETKFAQLVHNVVLASLLQLDTMEHNTARTKHRKCVQEHGPNGQL